MSNRFLAVLCVLLPNFAFGLEADDLFDEKGRPQPAVQSLVNRAGLPDLIEGVGWQFPRKQNLMEQTGCVTVRFLVRPDGLTDEFQILDSQPKAVFDQVVLRSLAVWKFKPTRQSYDAILPLGFGFVASTGSHIGRNPPTCLSPSSSVSQQDVRAKAVVNRRAPFYTPQMIESRIQGCVKIGFAIRADGLADDYELLAIEPQQQALADEAIKALNLWTFESPTPGGERSSVTFNFRISPLPSPLADCNKNPVKATSAGASKS